MNVHLCGLWPDFGNESQFCRVSVDWQSLQENGVQQVKGIPKSRRDDAQQSHRSLQQQTAWLKGWELGGIPKKTNLPFPQTTYLLRPRDINELLALQKWGQVIATLLTGFKIQFTTFNSEEKPIMRAQLIRDTEICDENILLKKKERKEERKSQFLVSSRSPGHPGQSHQSFLSF